jgi:hypothetical protein
MGTERAAAIEFIAKEVRQNGRFLDRRNLSGVLNAFLGLYPLPELTLAPTWT